MADDETFVARSGVECMENVDVGITSHWKPESSQPEAVGIYATYDSPDFIIVDNPFGWGPDGVEATGYVGLQLGANIEDKTVFVGPITGLRVFNIFVMEYQKCSYGDKLRVGDDPDKVLFGLKLVY